MTVRVIYGRADYDGLRWDDYRPGSVRFYWGDDGTRWIGTDSYDVAYYVDIDSAQRDLPWLTDGLGSYLFLDAGDGNGTNARERIDHAETADVETVHGDWPDCCVYDPHTGELVHEGEACDCSAHAGAEW
jgi:hypothetical protein